MFTYLLVHLFSVFIPVIRSFEKTHIYFAGKFRFLFPATVITAVVFIAWDVLFTQWGVWGFSHEYTMNVRLLGLPVEEWLFFFTIPYVCLFTYEVLNYFIKPDLLGRAAQWISWALLVLFSMLLIVHHELMYTRWVLLFNVFALILVGIALRPKWLGRFYLMFAVIIIPFLLVNGVLTGSFFDRVVVWYSSDFITEFRILTIPIEDLFYAFGMLLMVTALYEFFRKRAGKSLWSVS
jgi:lycopene cyclase domain-containing protein